MGNSNGQTNKIISAGLRVHKWQDYGFESTVERRKQKEKKPVNVMISGLKNKMNNVLKVLVQR